MRSAVVSPASTYRDGNAPSVNAVTHTQRVNRDALHVSYFVNASWLFTWGGSAVAMLSLLVTEAPAAVTGLTNVINGVIAIRATAAHSITSGPANGRLMLNVPADQWVFCDTAATDSRALALNDCANIAFHSTVFGATFGSTGVVVA